MEGRFFNLFLSVTKPSQEHLGPNFEFLDHLEEIQTTVTTILAIAQNETFFDDLGTDDNGSRIFLANEAPTEYIALVTASLAKLSPENLELVEVPLKPETVISKAQENPRRLTIYATRFRLCLTGESSLPIEDRTRYKLAEIRIIQSDPLPQKSNASNLDDTQPIPRLNNLRDLDD